MIASPGRLLLRQTLLMLAVAVLSRVALYGNPVIHSDEQFYLLVGDRLLGGALPYVDIWDRKPPGLFLLYAAIRLLGGNGVLAYQLMATLAAAATALVACRVAMRFAAPMQAAAAGVLYLVWLILYDGAGGQSPVFHNLPVALAALLTARAFVDPERRRAKAGAVVMTLLGIAIQIKTTVALEGAAFGVAWLWLLRSRGASIAAAAEAAVIWAAVALLPTLAAWVYYTSAGHGAVFVHAIVLSGFERDADGTMLERLAQLAAGMAGVATLLAVGWRGAWTPVRVAACGWAAAAFAAILVIGTFKAFYFLPLILPAAIVAAPGLTRRTAAVLLLAGAVAAVGLTVHRIARRGDAAQVAALVRLVGPKPPGCLFVFGSEPILYHLTRSCLPGRFLFRSHLGKTHEARALGVDPVGETKRIVEACPGVIVVRASKDDTNAATERVVLQATRKRYVRVGTVRVGARDHVAYRLRPGACFRNSG